MKTWILGAMMVGALALVACGGDKGGEGGGGSGTTSTTVSSTKSTTVSTTSKGSDPCADGSDCSLCADRKTCFDCASANHPTGSALYETLAECVICTACYTVCDGANAGCPMPPATKDACDMGTPGDAACSGMGMCQDCSLAGTCKADLTACQGSADCMGFAQEIQGCPAQ